MTDLELGHTMIAEFVELHYSIKELAELHKMTPKQALKLMCDAMTEEERIRVRDKVANEQR